MSPSQAEPALKSVESLFRAGTVGAETDGRLLARFLDGEPAIAPHAFAAIVERHAGMVLGVCRRAGLDPHDAEDAAQATFLILARRAKSIRDRDSLASWLFGVADRVAKRARADAIRRREHERRRAEMTATRSASSDDPSASVALDEEIARLPDRIRDPIVVCYLEGLTQEQAASRLNLPLRTIQRRLAQGRERLRARLERRGFAVPNDGPNPAIVLLPFGRPIEPTTGWIAETAATASGYAKGGAVAGAGSLAAKILADETMRTLTMTKLRVAALLTIAGTIGLAGLIPLARGQKPPEAAKPSVRGHKPPEATKPIPDRPNLKAAASSTVFTVRDSKTKRPIAGATVGASPKDTAASDAEGRAEIHLWKNVDNQVFSGWVEKSGYVPLRIDWSAEADAKPPAAYTVEMEPGSTIGGKVLDDDYKPVAGAKVHLIVDSNPGSNDGGVADPEHCRVNIWDEIVLTGPDGSWHHDEMPAKLDQILIRLEHPEFIYNDKIFDSDPIPPMGKLRDLSSVMQMRKGVEVVGRVVDDQGRPIAGASVLGSSDEGGAATTNGWSRRVETAADGRFRLPQAEPGFLTLVVKAKGHAPDFREVDAQPGFLPVEFRLGPPATIRGRVVDRRGKPVARASVFAYRRGYRSHLLNVKTDIDGRYRLEDAPADDLLIQAVAVGFMNSPATPHRAGGDAAVITLVPPMRLTGRVVDAETGEAIPNFHVIGGDGSEDSPLWDRANVWTYQAGRYGLQFTDPYPLKRVFRAEAEGYVPAISPTYAMTEGGSHTHDFRLTRKDAKLRPAVSGIILKADGTLASGVTVNLATVRQPIELVNGVPRGTRPHPTTKAGADGSFRFPPQEDPGWVLVLDDSGFATASDESLRETPTMRLAAWGRVEGVVRSGAAVVPGAKVRLARDGWIAGRGSNRVVYTSDGATTGTDGTFAIERAFPGTSTLFRMVPTSLDSASSQSRTRIEVGSGATVRVTIGGGGRRIVGRVMVPERAGLNIDWSIADNKLQLPEPPIPEPPNLTPVERKVWREHFDRSDAGRAYAAWQEDPRKHAVAIDPDGLIRIEDVRPGTYTLQIRPLTARFVGAPLGLAQAVVVVPEIADGDLTKPLDVGEIPLKPSAR